MSKNRFSKLRMATVKLLRQLVSISSIFVIALQSGCANLPQSAPNKQSSFPQPHPWLGKVAVMASDQPPEIKFEGFARGRIDGAVRGIKVTFGPCMQEIHGLHCSGGDSICGAIVITWLGICGAVGTVGGLAGALTIPSEKDIAANVTAATKILEVSVIQNSLRDQVIAAAATTESTLTLIAPENLKTNAALNDYHSLALDGVDTVLEVGLAHITTEGKGPNPPLVVRMTAHVRLVRTNDNKEIYSGDYQYLSDSSFKFDQWTANNAELLLHTLQSGYISLGSDICKDIITQPVRRKL